MFTQALPLNYNCPIPYSNIYPNSNQVLQRNKIVIKKKTTKMKKRKEMFVEASGRVVKHCNENRQVFSQNSQANQTKDVVKRRSEVQNPRKKLNFTEEPNNVCSALVDEALIPHLPLEAIEILFNKSVAKLKEFRRSTMKAGSLRKSPKYDPRTAEIFKSKTLLYRKLKTMRSSDRSSENEMKDVSQNNAVKVCEEATLTSMDQQRSMMKIEQYESVDQSMEWHGNFTSTN